MIPTLKEFWEAQFLLKFLDIAIQFLRKKSQLGSFYLYKNAFLKKFLEKTGVFSTEISIEQYTPVDRWALDCKTFFFVRCSKVFVDWNVQKVQIILNMTDIQTDFPASTEAWFLL